MPVTAHVPIRLRIDPALAGAEVDGAVRAAVAAAVGRSLLAFEAEVLDDRGGYARPGFRSPQFSWGGRPVSADWRQAIEQACAEEIAALTRPIAARVDERLRRAPPVVPPDPFERIDPMRFAGATYRVASYEGDTPSPETALYFESADYAAVLTPAGHHADWWEWDGSDEARLEQAIVNVLAQRYGAGRYPRNAGVIFWNRATDGFIIKFLNGVRSTRTETGRRITWRSSATLPVGDIGTSFSFSDNSVGEASAGFRPFGEYQFRLLTTVQTSNDIAQAILQFYLLVGSLTPNPVAGEPAETTTKRNLLQQYARDVAGNITPASGAIYVLAGGGSLALRHYGSTLAIDDTIAILPMGAFQVGALAEDGEEGSASRIHIGEGDGEGGAGGNGADGAGGDSGGAPEAGEEGGLIGEATSFRYPFTAGRSTLELDLGPFMGEPSIDQLGALGDRMRRLIQRIAFRLDMPEGKYCGAFLIAAAQVIGAHASGIADFGEYTPEATRVVQDGTGNLGYMEMQPEITPAVQLMRYLGGTCPLISELSALMEQVYQLPDVRRLISGMRHNEPNGWLLDFYREHTPAMSGSVAWVYERTCQLMMLQLLRASHEEIERRLTNFNQYFPIAEALITRLLGGEADLQEMRQMLLTVMSVTSPSASLSLAVENWRDARRVFTTTLSSQMLNLAAVTSPGRLLESRGTLELYADGWKVRDPQGRRWTLEEIERDIAMRHQTAQSIDPLIQQFVDIPEVVATFRDSPTLARSYLQALLNEMRSNNEDIERRVRSENMFAFRSGGISEDLPNRTVNGTSVAMRGIHLMAHDAIGESFRSNHWYAAGLNHAFNVELGRQGMRAFLEGAGTLVLSVLCPPLGFAIGVGVAVSHYHDAAVREELFGSLIDPGLLMSRAEVEFEMFMAQFELALSIIPDLGAIMRGGSRVLGAGANAGRRGARAAVRGALTSMRRQLLASMARQLRMGLARAFVEAVLIDRVMTLILPHLLGPIMEAVNREISVLSGEAVAPLSGGDADAAPPALSPEEAELVRRLEEYQEGDHSETLPPASEAP